MPQIRFLIRLLALLGLVIILVPLHLFSKWRGASSWPQRFLGMAARFAGFRVKAVGAPLHDDVFFIANHLSWIDILALGGATGCAFISKDGVANTPVIHWLARQNNTIFVSRERRGEIGTQVDAVRTAMASHQPIALFPEGTTGDGKALLPFKPALFAVLLPPPRTIRIQPVVIDYGDAASIIAWREGESGLTNAIRLLGSPGVKLLKLHFLPSFDPDEHPDRKLLASQSRARILAAQQEIAHAGTAPPQPQ